MTKEDIIRLVKKYGDQELVVETAKAMKSEGLPLTEDELERRIQEKLNETKEVEDLPTEVESVQGSLDASPSQQPAPSEPNNKGSIPLMVAFIILNILSTLLFVYSFSIYAAQLSASQYAGAVNMPSMGLGVYIGMLVMFITSIVPTWVIFTKAGKPGWASVIPIYNIFVEFEIIWGRKTSALRLLIPFYNIYWMIRSIVELGNRFDKGGGFKVGLVFLTNIFMIILAFDSSTYKETDR